MSSTTLHPNKIRAGSSSSDSERDCMQFNQNDFYSYLMYRNQQSFMDPKYKTELCKTFITEGFCKYNLRCRFAHGLMDLIPKKKQIKSSAECPSFSLVGFCQFGERCGMTHSDKGGIDQERVDICSLFKCEKPKKRLSVFVEIEEDLERLSTETSKNSSEDEREIKDAVFSVNMQYNCCE